MSRYFSVTSPFIKPQNTVAGVMVQVLIALIPGLLLMVWHFGWGVLVNVLLAVTTALAMEWLMLRTRGLAAWRFLLDGSAVLTATLLALALPPLVPWWVVVIGIGFAIVIAKHLYGGLGYNLFNPAMVGYAALLISFPKWMTLWALPHSLTPASLNLTETLQFVFAQHLPVGLNLDAITRATPLDSFKTAVGLGQAWPELRDRPVLGWLAGRGWEWVSLAYLAGGLWLVRRKAIAWQIPAGFLSALAGISFLFWWIDGARYAPPWFHLLGGATMLGAFFIATDPVTASTTPRGRWYFGAAIGVLVWLIRSFGGYPDGVAFAVLLLNMAVPLLDQYTRPRVFGHRRGD